MECTMESPGCPVPEDVENNRKECGAEQGHVAAEECTAEMIMPAMSPERDESSEGIYVKPDFGTIATVEGWVEEQLDEAGVGMREANKINISVDELYTNIVQYSGASRAEIVCRVTEESITVILRDNGIPYNPLNKADPDITRDAESREIGGLGIFMTKKLMSDVSYAYENGCNSVTLTLLRGKK